MQNPDAITEFIQSRVPGLKSVQNAVSIAGGTNNQVWRLSDGSTSVIVKYAPPFVAMDPDVPLDEYRIVREANALSLFWADPLLKSIASEQIRPVRMMGLMEEEHVMVLEDLGNAPDIVSWLERSASGPTHIAAAKLLATFFGHMHAKTAGSSGYTDRFENRELQERRFVEYFNAVGPALREAGFPDWDAVDDQAQRLGLRLLDSGVCLTKGDLLPKSVRLVPTGLRLLDWETCHVGLPAQDVAHLSAHLWMHAHCVEGSHSRRRLRTFNAAFVDMYQRVIRKEAPRAFVDDDFIGSHGVLFGCELLKYTVGDGQSEYLYRDGPTKGEKIGEAVSVAVNSITGDTPFFRVG